MPPTRSARELAARRRGARWLIANADVSPQHLSTRDDGPEPSRGTRTTSATELLGQRHDLAFLAGHFSANSALAADYQTSLMTTDSPRRRSTWRTAIVISAGCHSGYNLVDSDALPGVALPSTGPRRSRRSASARRGTGYQYGDTDFLEYSERI